MKIPNTEEQVEILDHIDVWSEIRKIASNVNQEEAFYVCSINNIVEKHKIWSTLLPRVKPHYAVKCNDNRTVLQILAALGTNFDCASKAEINKVLSIGVSTDRIIFAHPVKPASHIKYASSVGVTTMTFDNECELYKVQNLYPNSRLVIRIRCDAIDSQCNLGIKFGCDPIKEAPKLLHIAKSLNLNVVGVSFHVGSGCREPEVYHRAIAYSRQIFDYAESLGFNFSLVDIGGGYPGEYGACMEEMSNIINSALEEFFPDPSIQVIAEPGRYYVSSAYALACNIHCIKEIPQEDEMTNSTKIHRMYYINDGVYGSLSCILNEFRIVHPLPLQENPGTKIYSSSVWGPTCDGLDLVVKDIPLPEMKVGDWFVFENMGAYTLPLACQFNGFPFANIHYVVTEDLWSQLKGVLALSLSPPTFKPLNRRASLQDHLNFSRNQFNPSDLPATIQLPHYDDRAVAGNYLLKYIDISSVKE